MRLMLESQELVKTIFRAQAIYMWHFIVIHIKISITEGRRTIRCKLTDETGLWLEI